MRLATLAVLPLLVVTWARSSSAAPIVLDGEVPKEGGDFLFVPFDVPAGTVEIAISHDDLSKDDILDWGLDDPNGFRGWGGGNEEDAIVSVEAASRSYVPGPLPAGRWRVVIGKAKIKSPVGKYHLEIELRTTATLPTVPRKPWTPRTLESKARWYAGDFHVHSRESGDAHPTLDEITAYAGSHGLDFVEISDHNVVTQVDFFEDAQAKSKVLLIPGIEYTTYQGHANAIGATRWLDHRIGTSGTVEAAIQSTHDQGGLFSINHPGLDLGDQCIGCAWKHDVPAARLDAIEIETGGLHPVGFLFYKLTVQIWEAQLDTGAHVPPIGGSDDHKGGKDLGPEQSAIGNPTTMVFARELSVNGILDGIREGRTVVKLQGPDDPMIDLTTDAPLLRDTVSDEFVVVRATITGGTGQEARFVRNGVAGDLVPITSDPFVYQQLFEASEGTGKEDRIRAEVLVDGTTRTLTSHVFLRFTRTGRARPSNEPAASEGCGCRMVTNDRTGLATGTALLIASLIWRKRRKDRRSRRTGSTTHRP